MNQDIISLNLAAVEEHFHSEHSDNVDRALELFTDDVVWEAPNPIGLNTRLEGKEAVGKFYKHMFTTMKNVEFSFIERFATEDRVVDDAICTFEVAREGFWKDYQAGDKVKMRIVHIFDMRDGKISKEKVFEMRKVVT